MNAFVGSLAARRIGIVGGNRSPALDGRRRLFGLLVTSAVWGCAHAETLTGIAQKLTPTADTLRVRLTMNPVSSIPLSASSAPKPVRIRFGPHVNSTRPSALFVVDGKVIGQRSDGSIDHMAAGQWLRTVDPRRIVSIEIVKGADAVRRFGPNARNDAVLFSTAADSSRGPIRAP